MYADGYITTKSHRVGISLAKKDYHHIEKFRDSISSNAPIHTYNVTSGYLVGSEYARIIISDQILAEGLINAGCVEQKTNILKFPDKSILHPNLYHSFIRGYFDGDGSIYYSHGQYHIKFVGTDNILDNFMDILLRENITNKIYPKYKRKEGQIASNFGFGGNYIVKRFCDYIYNDASVYLDRKFAIYQSLLKEINMTKPVYDKCDICGCTTSGRYIKWKRDDEYNGMILCQRHYGQLNKYGFIKHIETNSDIKKYYCDICGETCGKMTLCKKEGDYYNMTLCKKHYEQIYKYGTITNPNIGVHKNV